MQQRIAVTKKIRYHKINLTTGAVVTCTDTTPICYFVMFLKNQIIHLLAAISLILIRFMVIHYSSLYLKQKHPIHIYILQAKQRITGTVFVTEYAHSDIKKTCNYTSHLLSCKVHVTFLMKCSLAIYSNCLFKNFISKPITQVNKCAVNCM